MIECSINNLVKYYGANKVFENISFELQTDERVGMIGLNGSGKTTLMKILMGLEEYQEGSISFRKGIKIGYLDQIYKCDSSTTVIDILESSFEDIWSIRKEIQLLEKNMTNVSSGKPQSGMNYYSALLEKFELLGGYNVETNINKICNGLLIPDNYREKYFEDLSGGEKSRILLAKLLLEEPDILLLDEPTNHLDIKSIEWLEEFLSNYKGTILMVSHDRIFLDKVANRIIELEPTIMKSYIGNYSDYIVEKKIRFEHEYNEYVKNKRKIEQMERQIERYRIWGAMRDSEKMYKRAKELEKRLEKVEVLDKPNLENSKIKLSSSHINRTGKIVLEANDLSKSFGTKDLFKNLSFTLYYKDKLCIMGENGSGKSTLLKILLSEISCDSGTCKLGSNVLIGYLPQNIVFEDENLSILEYFSSKHKISQSEARQELSKMLFIKDDVFKKIKFLSGGEKSRLKLASLIFDKVNVMILDEPTNHLDIDSREVLEENLLSYNGTILFVSHDRYFIRKIATKILILNKNNFKFYSMPYDEYLEIKDEEAIESTPKIVKKEKQQAPKPLKRSNNIYKLNKLEEEIREYEVRLNQIDLDMSIYSSDADKLYRLYIDKNQFEELLLKAYETFEELKNKDAR